MDDGWRNHEVRTGFALTWLKTWPERGGHGYDYAGREGGVGWVSGSRYDAVQAARAELRARPIKV